ncbi:MAG TPA: type II toxin-antitoxin system VapC family toxin, partial [Blastocatellia bacterium]|nr:type II toxin-antitoxin system VapC family toxin [Blastocatellia bacterium]
MRYYLDSAPIIYLVEQRQPFAGAARSKLAGANIVHITSELARLECRVKPMQTGDQILLKDFDDYFNNTIAEIVPLTRDVVDKATEIRARFNFKTPDSLHLAAAVISNCDVFLTNDHRLDRFVGITIEIL